MLDDAPIVVAALESDANRKTGRMLQTYIMRADQSPLDAVRTGADASICGDCVHRGDGAGKERTCYVTLMHGPRAVHDGIARGIYAEPRDQMNAARDMGKGRMVRMGTYGDPAAAPLWVWYALTQDALGWTGYTHQWRSVRVQGLRDICMASVDTEREAREAQALGWRTFRVTTANDAPMAGEVLCPASAEAGRKLTCKQCRACSGAATSRRGSIYIPAHGSGASARNVASMQARIIARSAS